MLVPALALIAGTSWARFGHRTLIDTPASWTSSGLPGGLLIDAPHQMTLRLLSFFWSQLWQPQHYFPLYYLNFHLLLFVEGRSYFTTGFSCQYEPSYDFIPSREGTAKFPPSINNSTPAPQNQITTTSMHALLARPQIRKPTHEVTCYGY